MKENREEILLKGVKESQKPWERYRIIFESSLDAIFMTDSHYEIKDINQAGVNLLGYDSKEEVMALRSAFELFIDKDWCKKVKKRVSQEGLVTEFETRLVGKQGQVLNTLVTSNVIIDLPKSRSSYVFIVRDITRMKRVQKEIEIRNIRLATLNSISMTVSSSLDLKEILNRTIDRILEILESDSVRIYLLDDARENLNLAANKGLSSKFIGKIHMKCRKVGDGVLGRTVLTKETTLVDNFLRMEDPYVDCFIEEGLQSTIYIPLISKGEAVGVMCVSNYSALKFSDDYVEFLKAIGNQIGVAVHNANLYENVKNAYEELKLAQEQVIRSEKLASLGKLAATVAHEINNPLTAVLTYIRLMMKLVARKRFTIDRMKDISRYLETMELETARCGEIVNGLLAFSRQSSINVGIYSIEEIVNKSLALLAHDLEIRNIELEKNIASDLPSVKCDSRQIQQVLLNLISNASESMAEGGKLWVEAVISKRKGFIEIKVSDTGCGISPKDMINIFEPFYTTKDEGKGVGLGLSVAYGIVKKHNGSIEIESKVGKGSTFRVQLPFA